jgi:hypothetical protein
LGAVFTHLIFATDLTVINSPARAASSAFEEASAKRLRLLSISRSGSAASWRHFGDGEIADRIAPDAEDNCDSLPESAISLRLRDSIWRGFRRYGSD